MSPRDSLGHGTHVSSISGGRIAPNAIEINGAFGSPRGVAFNARISSYKAIWCGGYGSWSDVGKAIDLAVRDGVDLISMSLGTSSYHCFSQGFIRGSF